MFSVSQSKREASSVGNNIIMALGGTVSVGTGGIFVGLRQAGFKGALLGGLTGMTGKGGIVILAGTLGLLGGPMTIFAVALAGLIGTLSGKFAVDKLLVQERIDKFKNNIKSAVCKQFKDMKLAGDFTDTVRRQTFEAFQGLKTKIENETEVILLDTQKTLDSLNKLKLDKKKMTDMEKESLNQCAEYIGQILAQTYILHTQLTVDSE